LWELFWIPQKLTTITDPEPPPEPVPEITYDENGWSETVTDNATTYSTYEAGKIVEQSVLTFENDEQIKQEDSTFDEQGKVLSKVITTFENAKIKATITQDFIYQANGNIFMTQIDTNGNAVLCDELGKPLTGEFNEKMYKNGVLANGTISGKLCQNGFFPNYIPDDTEAITTYDDYRLPLEILKITNLIEDKMTYLTMSFGSGKHTETLKIKID